MPTPSDQWEVRDTWRSLFDRHGVNSMRTLLAVPSATELGKPGLPGWRSRKRIELVDEFGARQVFFVKVYEQPPITEQVKRIFRQQAFRGLGFLEWDWSRRLHGLGIPAVEAAAYGQEFKGIRELRSVLVTKAAAGRSLEAVAKGGPSPFPRSLVLKVAELARELHGHGFAHRDLYLCHIFHEEQSDRLCLIDLQRMIAPRWRRKRWWIKDLAALNYSTPPGCVRRSERWRFLLRYLSTNRLNRENRDLLRGVLRRTRKMAAHDERKGRIQPWQRVWLTVGGAA